MSTSESNALGPEPSWRTRYAALVCHPSAPRVLLVPQGDGWGLPRWEVPGRRWFDDTAAVLAALRDHLGTPAFVLRYSDRREDEAARMVTATCLVEPRDRQGEVPAGARWMDLADLATLRFARPEERPAVLQCLDELAGGAVPPERNAYAMRGWFATASAWIDERLRAAGRAPSGPVEQVKTWGISCVLRVPTAGGDVYLKAPSRHFAREAPVTTLLAAWYPDRTPEVIAVDAARGWLLLEDVGPSLSRRSPEALWDRAVELLGEIHRGCAPRTAALLAAGAEDRRLPVLRETLPALSAMPEVRADSPPDLLARLQRAVPRLQALCDELAGLGIPDTLIHGDVDGHNTGVRDGHIRFFDWTDAAVTHPFLDLVTLLPPSAEDAAADAGGSTGDPDSGARHARLRDRYLAGFAGLAPPARRRRAFALAWCLGGLHQVVSYAGIARSVEPDARTGMAGALASWLRRALDRADRLDPGPRP